MMDESRIRQLLVDKGTELFHAPRTLVEFTRERAADELLNDLEGTPHAFVLACIMDRQVKAELAWLIPYRFMEKLGDFEFSTLKKLSPVRIEELMTQPAPLHRSGRMNRRVLRSCIDSWNSRAWGPRLPPWQPMHWPASSKSHSRTIIPLTCPWTCMCAGYSPGWGWYHPIPRVTRLSTGQEPCTPTFPGCWISLPGRSGGLGADRSGLTVRLAI
jgi:hypothetical protein